MKILAFVDTHGSVTAIKRLGEIVKKENPDIIIGAGDLTIFGANLDLLLHKMNTWQIPILLIHGNHEAESELKKACSLFKNTIFLHKTVYEYNDFLFVGYGGGGFSLKDGDFEQFTRKLELKKPVILVVHAPPYGTKLDFIDSHHGNKSYRKFIEQQKPVLVICGHLHENRGKEDKIGPTRIINPGYGKIITI